MVLLGGRVRGVLWPLCSPVPHCANGLCDLSPEGKEFLLSGVAQTPPVTRGLRDPTGERSEKLVQQGLCFLSVGKRMFYLRVWPFLRSSFILDTHLSRQVIGFLGCV